MKLLYDFNSNITAGPDFKLDSGKAETSGAYLLCGYLACALCLMTAAYAVGRAQNGYYLAVATLILGIVHFASRRYEPQLALPIRLNRKPSGEGRGAQTRSEPAHDEDLFRSAFNHAAGMAIVAPNGRWLTVNPALCETLGYKENELVTRSLQDVAHPDDLGGVLVQVDKLLNGSIPSCQIEQRYIHKLGHNVWVLLTISLIRDSQGDPLYLVCQFQDITRRKQSEERLVHDVFHDALTGLPNRALFMDRLGLAMERARRRKEQLFAVLFLDLDCFKTVNDTLGHMVGDQLLIEVARRLRSCLRTTDTVARLGGDEFTILLEELGKESESLRIVERFQKELARPFKFGSHEFSVTASIGIACNCAGYYETAEEILRDADTAMYRAKSVGKACYEIVDTSPSARQRYDSNLAVDLDRAIEREEFAVFYQPIVSLEEGSLMGLEALVRWEHPERGLISPTEFIPLAEESGLIIKLGEWVLRKACLQLRTWQNQYPFHHSLSVSVNLSMKQFMQPDLVNCIMNILQETDLDPRSLKLELTERVVMENIDTTIGMLQQLRALGVELGIDDFGTGYSSLSCLHRLPINSLKIDSSFVTGMVENEDNVEIIKTIVTLARSLGMSVVAEGVETVEQLSWLRILNCDAAQGFLFSKPTDAVNAGIFLGLRAQWKATMAALDTNKRERHEQPQRRYSAHSVTSGSPLLRAV